MDWTNAKEVAEKAKKIAASAPLLRGVTFEAAWTQAKQGGYIARAGWNGKNQFVTVQAPDENSKMTEPYAFLKNARGGLVPWIPSQGDLFACDWTVYSKRA